jgi:hypothetical protein
MLRTRLAGFLNLRLSLASIANLQLRLTTNYTYEKTKRGITLLPYGSNVIT